VVVAVYGVINGRNGETVETASHLNPDFSSRRINPALSIGEAYDLFSYSTLTMHLVLVF